MMAKLYHGSAELIEGEIKPSAAKFRDQAEGPVVFATSLPSLALTFILRDDDSWTNKGLVDGQPYVLVSDRQRYESSDRPAYIYEVEQASFTSDPNRGMGSVEYTSKSPAKIIGHEKHDSALTAMQLHGVTLCYVTKQEFMELTARGNIPRLCDKIKSQRAIDETKKELLRLKEEDQKDRLGIEKGELSWDRVLPNDIARTQRLKQIVEQFGWPRLSNFGPAASSAAAILLLHAVEPDQDKQKTISFMKRCRLLMKKALEANDIHPGSYPNVVDRILMFEGKPQIYGTQSVGRSKEDVKTHPIARPSEVNARRAKLGLGAIEI